MSIPQRNSEIAAERFALSSFGDESVLLDLLQGTFYRLNRVAAHVWSRLIDGQDDEAVAQELALTYAIPLAQASRDVASVWADVDTKRARCRVNPISFTADAGRHRMEWNGMPVCWLDPNSKQLSLCAESLEAPPAPWEQLLLWAVPHMLTLLRRDVLHASAVVLDGAAIAFCGSSGVGKTTLARTLTEQGATRASEDLVLLGSDGKSTHIVVGAEAILRAWAAESGPELAFKGRIRTDGLAAAAEGSRVPLQAVYFLDRFRRRTPSFERITLSPAAALVNLLENGFAELGQPPIWRQLLTASERLAREVKMFKLKCPEGVEELRRAAATYNWITKS